MSSVYTSRIDVFDGAAKRVLFATPDVGLLKPKNAGSDHKRYEWSTVVTTINCYEIDLLKSKKNYPD